MTELLINSCVNICNCDNYNECQNGIHYILGQFCGCESLTCPSMFPAAAEKGLSVSCTARHTNDICLHGYRSGPQTNCVYHKHWMMLNAKLRRRNGMKVHKCNGGEECKFLSVPIVVATVVDDCHYYETKYIRTCAFWHEGDNADSLADYPKKDKKFVSKIKMCKNGDNCHFFKEGVCKFGH